MAVSSHYLLGFDVGSSSVKATIIDSENGMMVGSATSPKQEMPMHSEKPGWAEQDPEMWWTHVKNATQEILTRYNIEVDEIGVIGISYQMHGLALVDKNHKVLRPSIIWCDSRAVEIGSKAFDQLGRKFCLSHYLNSPGNFTASKLKWVKDNEPKVFEKVHKFMLPGDYIAMRMTGEIQTTVSGISEGILWDFNEQKVAAKLLDHYGIPQDMVPPVVSTFGEHGQLTKAAAEELGLKPGVKVAYRAGDQPNNAFSLNVLEPGELAATAGTSGVVYGITDQPRYDEKSRVNAFVHVNHSDQAQRYGILLCLNGTGILNSWLKRNVVGEDISYDDMNGLAAGIPIGSEGVSILPFGNGAERILENRDLGAIVSGLNFNSHNQRHLLRAAQEGIVFGLNYGFNIMKDMGLKVDKVKAGNANMFLSPIFKEAFANTTGAVVELYNTDGSQGAARGAGVGAGIFKSPRDAFHGLKTIETIEPDNNKMKLYKEAYENWRLLLEKL